MAARSPAARAWRLDMEAGFAGRSNVGPRSVHSEGEHTRAQGLARGIVGWSAEKWVGRTRRKRRAVGHRKPAAAPRRGCEEAGAGVRLVGATGGLTIRVGRGCARRGHEVPVVEGTVRDCARGARGRAARGTGAQCGPASGAAPHETAREVQRSRRNQRAQSLCRESQWSIQAKYRSESQK